MEDNKIVKVLKFIILFSVVFVLLSTASTILCNKFGYYSRDIADRRVEAISKMLKVDQKVKKQADDNLEKIKNATNTNFNEKQKEKIVKSLEETSIAVDKFEKIAYKKHNNSYDAALYAARVKGIIHEAKTIEVLGTIMKSDVRSTEEKHNEEAFKYFRKSILWESLVIETFSEVIMPDYKYPNLNYNSKIAFVPYNYYEFSYDNYYLALTEYAMKVGGINE